MINGVKTGIKSIAQSIALWRILPFLKFGALAEKRAGIMQTGCGVCGVLWISFLEEWEPDEGEPEGMKFMQEMLLISGA